MLMLNTFASRHTRSRSAAPAGFTLVELLVVIAIVTVLIGLLLPALNRARQSANNLQCLSNLRTLSIAYSMYADANRGVTLANYSDTAPGHVANDGAWFTLLNQYLAVNSSNPRTTLVYYRCPIGRAYQQYGNAAVYSWDALDYALMDYSINAYGTSKTIAWAKITKLAPADQWANFFDYNYLLPTGSDDSGSIYANKFSTCVTDSTRYPLMYRHFAQGVYGIQAAFADGHAEFIPTMASRGATAATAAQAITPPTCMFGLLRPGPLVSIGGTTTNYQFQQ